MCKTIVFLRLNKFWNTLYAKLNNERPYKVNIGAMHQRLQELQETDLEAQKIRAIELQRGWEEVNGVLHHQRLLYLLKFVRSKLINKQHNDLLARYFGIDKTQKFISRKYN